MILQTWKKSCWNLELAAALTISGAIIALSGNYALAQSQIVPDNTLGIEISTVSTPNPDSVIDEIRGGAIRDTNLFHSFQEFNVSEGRGAYFISPNANIQNILARVTGGNSSEILGILGARGGSSPNLFLINPNGIIFGEKASLDVGGSFITSTASSLKFADGTDFSAKEPQTNPLLTVSIPIGLQFGADVGRIVNQSYAADYYGLQVQPGKTLALVGGDVSLEGGYLTAKSGRIELGSVADSNLVDLTPTTSGWALGYEGVQNFRDILLSEALVDATREGGGDIQVQGRRVTLTNGSSIQTDTDGSRSGGSLTVNASDSVSLIDYSILRADAEKDADGSAGNLRINTRKLIVQDGAFVTTDTLGGTAKGGDLFVSASESVELIGSGSGLFTVTKGAGAAGNLTIVTSRLSVQDGAQVFTGTLGAGQGGNLDVAASESVELIGSDSGLFTQAQTQGTGAAGNLTIATRRLSVGNGAQVAASTNGQGQGGKLRIDATESVNIFGVGSNKFSSGLFTRTTGKGQGGNIAVDTSTFRIADGAVVDARTTAAGNGGNITVNANTFEAVNGGQIVATAFKDSSGSAGNITVNTTDGITISGSLPNSIQRLIRVGSGISDVVENNDPPNSGLFVLSQGSGDAGNLQITASSIRLDNGGKLTATTSSGEGGNITIQKPDLLLLRGNSEIATDATGGTGNGGNITIDTDILAVVEKSNITANAVEGRGGKIRIAVQGLFVSPNSRITASSERGINGVVDINRPDIEPNVELAVLPAEIVDVSRLIAQGCPAGGGNVARGESKFVVTGRGGLPPNTEEAARSDTALVDLGTSVQVQENRANADISDNSDTSAPTEIVEAQGWMTNNKGEVVLTAQAPSVTPNIPWLTPVTCHASQN